mmetsp:Transcript_34479/g.67823  ORF Transcript_34479/g.67823 Transcript_34479/m.67823 type:complete len:216 (+) Transcript_34479:1607-2254(+)
MDGSNPKYDTCDPFPGSGETMRGSSFGICGGAATAPVPGRRSADAAAAAALYPLETPSIFRGDAGCMGIDRDELSCFVVAAAALSAITTPTLMLSTDSPSSSRFFFRKSLARSRDSGRAWTALRPKAIRTGLPAGTSSFSFSTRLGCGGGYGGRCATGTDVFAARSAVTEDPSSQSGASMRAGRGSCVTVLTADEAADCSSPSSGRSSCGCSLFA